MTYLRLSMEPIPAGSRLATLANLLQREEWTALRRAVYRRAGFRCEACARQDRLHCHEVWQYNPQTGYQWLRGFRALCPLCHDATHVTFVRDPGRRARLLEHFMAVNRLTRDQAQACLREAERQQRELDQRQWAISYGDYNLRMPALHGVAQRRQYLDASGQSHGWGSY